MKSGWDEGRGNVERRSTAVETCDAYPRESELQPSKMADVRTRMLSMGEYDESRDRGGRTWACYIVVIKDDIDVLEAGRGGGLEKARSEERAEEALGDVREGDG